MSKKYFCASDVHSFYTEWELALSAAGFDKTNPDHIIIVCGDLFDRGPESRSCYEFMTTMLDQNRAIYVRGNHEDLILDALYEVARHKHIGRHHISNGGGKFLQHYCKIVKVVAKNIYVPSFRRRYRHQN